MIFTTVNYFDSQGNRIDPKELQGMRVDNAAWARIIGAVIKRLEMEGIISQ